MRPNETDLLQQKAEFTRRWARALESAPASSSTDEGFVESPLGTARRETIAYSNSSDLRRVLLRDVTIRVTAVTEPTRDTVCLHWSLAFVAAVLPGAPAGVDGVSRWTLDYLERARSSRRTSGTASTAAASTGAALAAAWADVRGSCRAASQKRCPRAAVRAPAARAAASLPLHAHVAASVPFELWPVGVSALKRPSTAATRRPRGAQVAADARLVARGRRGGGRRRCEADGVPLIPLETSAAVLRSRLGADLAGRGGTGVGSLFAVARPRRTGPTTARARALELAALAEADGLEIASAAAPIVAQYRVDSLFAFQPRGNELWLPVVGDPYDF